MAADGSHAAAVDRWIARGGPSPAAERAIQRFESAFDALWARAESTLSHVTLAAIVDRVLHTAGEEHPLLSGVTVEATGLRCESLRARAGSLDASELTEAIRFVLVEFLTVLGSLTAEILTPDLHAELAKAPEDQEPDAAGKERP